MYASAETVGESGAGYFSQSGGTCTIGTVLSIGNSPGGSGSYSLSGSGLLSGALFEWVGYGGAGTFTQSGGTNAVISLILSGGSGATERTASAAPACCPHREKTSATSPARAPSRSPAGPTPFPGYLDLGDESTSSGVYVLSGSGLLTAQMGEIVGYSGAGTFTQSGGTNTASNLQISSATYNLNGGLLSPRG